MKLTDQQQAIVNHTRGPALVFAVAGSGKTTCMVQRIKQLVKKEDVPPSSILATSFNNSAVKDLRRQLAAQGVSPAIDCRTLHSLGLLIIRAAVRRKYLSEDWLKQAPSGNLHTWLTNEAITQLAIKHNVDASELNIDREDLRTQISIWKGNLTYAALKKTALPLSAASLARQAEHENELYLQAYQRYENIRRQMKVLTFDDMLLSGWELLLRHRDLFETIRDRYRYVLVDEFQDINFVQYRLLDLLTGLHGNYMVIGDDDQCIYEWRGANTRYILEFEKTYQAKVYTINDNFRSTAQQVLLANRLISNNKNRYPKQLSLTRGFEGKTIIHEMSGELQVARSIAGEIKRLLEQKETAAGDLAILIRLFSQTAFLETALIEKQVPYYIDGGEPFYKRSELLTLLQYLSFAFAERQIRKKGFSKDPQHTEKYLTMFESIINRPRRYVPQAFIRAIILQARQRQRSVIDISLRRSGELNKAVQRKFEEFARLIDRLIPKLRGPAFKTLSWLVDQIRYRDHLLAISGIYEVGVNRVQSVDALIQLSKIRRGCANFLNYIRGISLRPMFNPGEMSPIRILTIYKAKGLEWETVFVPGCNEGLIPCVTAREESEYPELILDIEAERRLFYVAITRAKKTLHLYYTKKTPISPFLSEIDAETLLSEVDHLRGLLFNKKVFMRQKDLIRLCLYIAKFQLQRSLVQWTDLPGHVKSNIGYALKALNYKITKAEKEYRRYQTELLTYRARKKQLKQQIQTNAHLSNSHPALVVPRKPSTKLQEFINSDIRNSVRILKQILEK